MSDSRELTAHDDGADRQIAAPRSTSITPADRLAMMREAMTNPAVDPEKARAMFALMGEMEDRERQAEFNRDKGLALRAMPAIFKNGRSDKHRYAKFEDMHRAAMPVLSRHHLTLDFRVGSEGNLITVQPILRHDNGFVEEGAVMKGPADTGPGRSQIQSLGSSSSYLKRYTMKGILNLIEDGEDDDGMGVARPDYQLNSRQEGLIVDAQMACDRGEYLAWFARLNTKDKAVVIGSGTHARLGGAPALPGAQTVDMKVAAEPEQDGIDAAREAIREAGTLAELERTWKMRAMAPHRDALRTLMEDRKAVLAENEKEGRADADHGDQNPGTEDEHPARPLVDDTIFRCERAQIIGDVIGAETDFARHREAVPEDMVAEVDRAVEAAKARIKGGAK